MEETFQSDDWATISSASYDAERRWKTTDDGISCRSRSLPTTHVLDVVTNRQSPSLTDTNWELETDFTVSGPTNSVPQDSCEFRKFNEEGFSPDLPVPDLIIGSLESDIVPWIANTTTLPPQTHSDESPYLYAMHNPIGAPESLGGPEPPCSSTAANAAFRAPGAVGEAARKMLVDSLAAGMDPNVALYVSRLVAKRMRNAISVGDDPREAMAQIVGTSAGRNDAINRALEFLRNPDLLPDDTDKLPTGWRPAQLFLPDVFGNQFALLVLNQPIEKVHIFRILWQKAFYRIAADGGGNRVKEAFEDPRIKNFYSKFPLNAICGDLDSLDPSAQRWAAENGAIVAQDSDQNSTDFGKCVDYLREEVFPKYQGATDIVCLGGLGGRVDQGISTIHHLLKFQSEVEYAASRFYLVSSEAVTFVLMPGKHLIRVKEEADNSKFVLGKHIGIIPIGKAAIINTKGLEWDVKNWHTEIGGQISTSNHVKDPVCEIRTTGPVLFTIELRFPSGACESLVSSEI